MHSLASRDGRRFVLSRAPVVLAWFLALVVSLFALRDADASASLAAASSIRAQCTAAKGALASAWTNAANRKRAYRSALQDGATHAEAAYRLAEAAAWPSELESERSWILASLMTTRSNIARLTEARRRGKKSQVRAALYPEILRLTSVVDALGTLVPRWSLTPPSAPAPAPSTDAMPLLVSGPGFGGPTGPMAQIGNGFAATETAIARWDVVPNQTVTARMPIGVVAFHVNGIDRVEFSLEAGEWRSVTAMSVNPVTGVAEYNALIDAATMPPGEFEVRAVAYPTAGVPRVLDTLVLVAAPGGTAADPVCWVDPVAGSNDTAVAGDPGSPAATIYGAVRVIAEANAAAGRGKSIGGGTVYLKAGRYSPGRTIGGSDEVDDSIDANNSRWLTVTRDQETPKSDVVIDQRGGLGILRARYADLTIHIAAESTYGLFVTSAPPDGMGGYVWLSNCDVSAYTRFDGNAYLFMNGWQGLYRDGCTFTEMAFGEAAVLARGDVFYGIVADIWSGCGMVVDGVASDVSRIGTLAHTDIYQFMTENDDGIGNIILYGVTAKDGIAAQGLFCGGGEHLRDIAFVNVDLNNTWGASQDIADTAVQMNSPVRHMYFKNCTIGGMCWLRPANGFTAKHFVVEGSTLLSHSNGKMEPDSVPGVTYR